MKNFSILVLLSLCLGGSAYAANDDYIQFQQILDTKCSKCHTRVRIEEAMRSNQNAQEVLDKMIRFGARISDQEREVLGVFWNAPITTPALGGKAGPTVSDPLGEYRTVLEARCTGCHSLERVEEAMQEGRSIEQLIGMMQKRGAIVTESDKSVLGTFWGNPLKSNPE